MMKGRHLEQAGGQVLIMKGSTSLRRFCIERQELAGICNRS